MITITQVNLDWVGLHAWIALEVAGVCASEERGTDVSSGTIGPVGLIRVTLMQGCRVGQSHPAEAWCDDTSG